MMKIVGYRKQVLQFGKMESRHTPDYKYPKGSEVFIIYCLHGSPKTSR